MPYGCRSSLLTALLVAPAFVAGCASDGETEGKPGFPWIVESEYPESRGDLKNASRLDLSYAQWQEQIGNVPEAQQTYQRVLKDNPRSLDAMLGLARLEQLAGHSEEAEKAFHKAIETAPGNPQALAALGQFYASEQRWAEAIAALGRAAEAAPEEAAYRHYHAVALARSGDTSRALAEFTKTVGEAEAHYNLGYIYREQGRKDLAEREFLQAITLRPDLRAAQAMLDDMRREGNGGNPLVQDTAGGPSHVTQAAATLHRSGAFGTSNPSARPTEFAVDEIRTAAAAVPVMNPPQFSAPKPFQMPSPDARPADLPPAAPVSTASAGTATASTAASPDSTEWETPARLDPSSILTEQMRNQAPLGE